MDNLRDYDDDRCKEYLLPDNGRQCSPNRLENLYKGDYIDFTFGTNPSSSGYFVFYIKGA
jgi:hypothetical protein